MRHVQQFELCSTNDVYVCACGMWCVFVWCVCEWRLLLPPPLASLASLTSLAPSTVSLLVSYVPILWLLTHNTLTHNTSQHAMNQPAGNMCGTERKEKEVRGGRGGGFNERQVRS